MRLGADPAAPGGGFGSGEDVQGTWARCRKGWRNMATLSRFRLKIYGNDGRNGELRGLFRVEMVVEMVVW